MDIQFFLKSYFLSLLSLLISFQPLRATPASYAIAQGEKDQERLTILNELYNEASLNLLKINPGMQILTIGCGIGLLELEIAHQTAPTGNVLATDISQAQLLIAEKNRQDASSDNLQFLQIDAASIADMPGKFDRIHCRFILSHLPWEQVIPIIHMLYNKLSPGGLLVLEEIASIYSLDCRPFSHPGYDKWKLGVEKQFALQQSHPSLGNRLYQYLQEAGFSATYSSYQPVLSTPRQKSILSLGIRSLSNRFLQEKLITQQEIDEMISLLQELEENPFFFPYYFEAGQITIQRP